MREPAFLHQNADRWKQFETLLASRKGTDPDQLAELFVQLTDDLSYARTFYPGSKTTRYLNGLAGKVHQEIYRNRKERSGRFAAFWRYEVPTEIWRARREMSYSAVFFLLSMLIGAVSAANDASFVRLILGDSYVNMTLDNISRGDPFAVYGTMSEGSMFLYITVNNILVALKTFAFGIALSLGTVYSLFLNGVMLGSFEHFLYQHGVFTESLTAVWIHGTLEITSIVIAGGAGLVMGNSVLFPKTYSRVDSLVIGAKRGLKIVVGLVPIFVMAGFLESFVTRHYQYHIALNLAVIIPSFLFIVGYFFVYPYYLHKRSSDASV